MPAYAKDLWSLVLDQKFVAPMELAEAVEDQANQGILDFRTRLLIRDSLDALQRHWGQERLAAWLEGCPVGERIRSIWHEELGAPGFPFLREQLMEPTRPETIRAFLRELGLQVHQPVRFPIGGSGALILAGYLSRRTQDLDVVDEVPREIR